MEPQAPEPSPQPQKKKLGPLAWVLIGCLGIVILAGGAMLVGGFFVAKKVKDVAADYKENPARAAAEMVVRMNPELELVETDDEAQTVTIRNTETGEVITADWSDIQEGEFRIDADGKKVSFDAKQVADGEEGGMISVTDEAGDQTVVIGGDSSAAPTWFPAYSGAADAGSNYSSKSGSEVTGMFTFSTGDGVAEVMDYYRDELTDLGFELSENTFTSGEVEGGSLTGEDDESGRTINMGLTRQEGTTQVGVNYTERQE